MANYYICVCIFKLALPIILGVCTVFRPCLLSAIYLLFLLCIPLLPVPQTNTMSGITGVYLKILIIISILAFVAQVAFQVVLFSLPPYGYFLENCNSLEEYLRYAGFVKFEDMSLISAITWISPEVILCIGSVTVYIICQKLTIDEFDSVEATRGHPKGLPDRSLQTFFNLFGKYLTLIALCAAAILRPSVIGGFYFLIFLISTTWWSFMKKLSKGFALLLRGVMVVVFLQIYALYMYQFQWFQEYVPSNATYARYFGLTQLMTVKCDDPREFLWVNVEWASYLNPFALFLLFYILAAESSHLSNPKMLKKASKLLQLESSFNGRRKSTRFSEKMVQGTTRQRWQTATKKEERGNSTEGTPLIRSGTISVKKYGTNPSRRKGTLIQDSSGSVIVSSEPVDEIPLEDMGKGTTVVEDQDLTNPIVDNIVYVIVTCIQMVVRASYIITNIIMMTWSITFHSWITFVLLLWAIILWMVPNQRRAMLRCSPFLVFYAWFLLIAAYVYSMDLTESELPTKIQDINLRPIGFEKIKELPCIFLLVKCLYTTVFWLTLRQYMQERQEARQTTTISDMVAPLQVTVGTATGVPKEEEKGVKIMQIVGRYIKSFLTKFWIWGVAITLFAVAITGARVTSFRIIYMALFLIFIVGFQLSFRLWRRLMFVFWVVVILYSMLVLILIYTYQFSNIRRYWTEYIHISIEQQKDIGLEDYGTKQLFIRLASPTFFVIITAIQLHYFHKDFLEISDPKVGSIIEPSDGTSAQGGIAEQGSSKTDIDSSLRFDISDLTHLSSVNMAQKMQNIMKKLHHFFNLVYLFLELHLPKLILLLGMIMCIYDRCAIYLVVVIIMVFSFTMGRSVSIICLCICSVIVSILLLARMIYQIEFITHSTWDTNCTTFPVHNSNISNYTTVNSAEWLGFYKESENKSLSVLVKWNIIFILAMTLWTVVRVRQYNYRVARGWSTKMPFFMFPSIKRTHADENITNCLKYLLNYGFYKFGIEFCLIAMVGVIGFRMDAGSVIYGIWLCVLYSLSRRILSRVWDIFMYFMVVFIPIQYFMVIGLPPNLCIYFPWEENNTMKRLHEWAFLLNQTQDLPAEKLLCDFTLLLFASRVSMVFRIERRNIGLDYPGGSNESVIHHAEEKGFVIPVPDFITYCRSYLDIVKRSVLLSWMWISLAILFLAGTNRVTMFSIGYLIGSFIFLWKGSDLYLKPIPKLVHSWNLLLAYNVVVILLKTLIQLAGCVYIDQLEKHACWFVQLFAVGCLNKFGDNINLEEGQFCTSFQDNAGLAWDGITFASLLMQKRVFQSYNFFHIINETKAATILASRGADLIEEIRIKKMKVQEEDEMRILQKIKTKMDRIKRTQQRLHGPSYKDSKNHFIAQPPLARSTSTSSCASATSQQTPPAGYHTPIDDDEPAPLTPHAGSALQNQVPSPFSAIMTGSLDAYLEPQRISFSSPPNSELNPRPPSPDDSFPVFSPPPYEAAPPYMETVSEAPTAPIQRQTSIGPPWMQGTLVTPRQSVISYSSRSPLSHHTYGIFPNSRPTYRKRLPKSYKEAIRSGDYYMFDDVDDQDVELEEEYGGQDESLIEGSKVLAKLTSQPPTIGELLAATLKTDITSTVRASTNRSKSMRRASMPPRRQSTASVDSQISAAYSAPPGISTQGHSVVIIDPKGRSSEYEPQPSTSKEDDITELSETKEPSTCENILTFIVFLWLFIESAMTSLTVFLNKYSQEYRYVLRILNKEKKNLKENTDYNVGLRLGKGQMWQPVGSYHSILKICSRGEEFNAGSVVDITEGAEMSSTDEPAIIRLILAVWYIIASHSDLMCYFMIFLNQIKTATFLSLPLPLMVFFWGSLSIPRPSKTFWVTIIAYTEVIVLIKCIFQFQILPWNKHEILYPFFPPRIIGVEKRSDYALWDLLLLLIVFFHRFLLKYMGLWKTSFIPAAILKDGHYTVTDDEIIAAQEGTGKTDSNSSILSKTFHCTHRIEQPMYLAEIAPLYPYSFLRTGLNVKYSRFLRAYLKTIVKSKSGGIPSYSGAIQPVAVLHIRKDSDLQKLMDDSEGSTGSPVKDDAGNDDTEEVTVHTERMHPCTDYYTSLRMSITRHGASIRLFVRQLIDPTSRVAVDVYSYMFLCDFFNFFVILWGYSSFGPQEGDEGVQAYIEENKVPVLFLLMLILQFTLIIVDRAIFLRKYIVGKVVFQYLQIIILHIWLFILYPIITERGFNSALAPQMYYMVKCFYLLLSAYQIRCGYPTRILGNFLCKGYNYVNMFLFKAFLIVPFLYELRTVMDWMWTDTSMTIFDWMKMEDIFAYIFQIKCNRYVENEFPQERGTKKYPLTKYLMGAVALLFMVAIIWFPLVFFSLGNAVGKSNIPYDLSVALRIGPFQPIYQMSVQSNSIYQLNNSDLERFMKPYADNKTALTFISNYEASDIAAIKFSTNSSSIWTISPPDRERLLQAVTSNNPLTIRFQYTVSHKSNTKEDSGTIREETEIIEPAFINGQRNPTRKQLFEMLNGSQSVLPIPIKFALPKFIKITNKGTAKSIAQLLAKGTDPRETTLRYVTVAHRSTEAIQGEAKKEWWGMKEICDENDFNYQHYLSALPYADKCESLIIYTFNDKIFPSQLNFITAGGIIGVYTTIVLVAGRILRGFFAGMCFKIMFEDMPNVDRILQLCYDIYLVREVREFALEEDLFAKLVFLFRSPETLIKWTRPKKESNDDENEEDEEQPAVQD